LINNQIFHIQSIFSNDDFDFEIHHLIYLEIHLEIYLVDHSNNRRFDDQMMIFHDDIIYQESTDSFDLERADVAD
jgi:hypothetical protein